MSMALDERALQEQLTPEQRRAMLRAFADRMLLKLAELEDPKVLADVERDVRVAAAIERIYSRCDRAEKHAPCRHKIEADRADNAAEAIRARNRFTQTFDWGEERRKALGRKWTKAQKYLKSQTVDSKASKSSYLPARGEGDHEVVEGAFPSKQPVLPNFGGFRNPTTTPSARSPSPTSQGGIESDSNPGGFRNPTTVCAPEGAGRPGTGHPASPASWGGIETDSNLGGSRHPTTTPPARSPP